MFTYSLTYFLIVGKGGKNRRRGKNENETEKRELVFKEDGQGKYNNYHLFITFSLFTRRLPTWAETLCFLV